MVSSFNSTEDLIQGVQASCHIPLISDARPTYSYRGKQFLDGAAAQFLPCPPGVAYCLRVSVLPAGASFAAPGLGQVDVGEATDIDPLKFGNSRCCVCLRAVDCRAAGGSVASRLDAQQLATCPSGWCVLPPP